MTCYSPQVLEAFHDGQLQGAEGQRVAVHSECCPICRAKLERLERLSAVLQDYPVPKARLAPERFSAQVRLQLQPRETAASRHRALAVPAVLVSAWAFVQAVWLVSGALLVASTLGLTGQVGLAWVQPGGTSLWRILQAWEPGWRGVLAVLSYSVSTVTSLLLPLVLLGGVGVLFWAWWFGWQQQAGHNQD